MTGLCHCGCGRAAPIAKQSNRRLGHVAGQPVRFVHGHHARLQETKLRYRVDEATGCWLWTGATAGKYGHVQYQGASMNAHRAVYLMLRGPIPDGLVLDHAQCDSPLCVNPDHMQPVSNTANIRRGRSCRLNAQTVRSMRRMWPEQSIASLARRFGVSETSVRRIVRRERWKDVRDSVGGEER